MCQAVYALVKHVSPKGDYFTPKGHYFATAHWCALANGYFITGYYWFYYWSFCALVREEAISAVCKRCANEGFACMCKKMKFFFNAPYNLFSTSYSIFVNHTAAQINSVDIKSKSSGNSGKNICTIFASDLCPAESRREIRSHNTDFLRFWFTNWRHFIFMIWKRLVKNGRWLTKRLRQFNAIIEIQRQI